MPLRCSSVREGITPSDRERQLSAARQGIRQGNVDLARNVAADLLSQRTDDLDALEIKALVEIERGDNKAAEATLRRAISIAPERRWPYADLTRLLLKLGRKQDAEDVARAALHADQKNADAHAMLATLSADREDWFEAAAHFKKATALVGSHPQLLTGLGQALLRLGRLDEARKSLETAGAADPDALEPIVYLAELEERVGRFEEAAKLLDRAEPIARRQGVDVDLQRSVLLGRLGKNDEALALLESRPDLSGAALLQRGRLRDRAGRYDEAWSDWISGKAQLAERSCRFYDADTVAAEADRLLAFASQAADHLPQASKGSDVPQPLFIIGFPRSGTTVTEQILSSHGAIRAGGELPFGAEMHELASADSAEKLRVLYLAKAESYGLLATGAKYFTDKMPDNAFWLPLVRLAFPHSPVILVRRHPLDVLTSVMAHDMTHGFNCSYRIEDAARHLALIDRQVETYADEGFGPTYELRYESLIGDQVGETERLMAAIGLKMEPQQLRFHEGTSVPSTPSYAQVRKPLNDKSVGRWKKFARQLESVRPIIAEAMERGGYAS
jgi:Flp pilus assembly protein TadD